MSKKCKVCSIELNSETQYKGTNLLCKKHKIKAVYKGNKKYATSLKGKKALARASQKAYLKHREKWIARTKVRYAVKTGKLIKPENCEVCDETLPLQGHHEDYSKIFEVIWLCSRCHADADRNLEQREKLLFSN